jgi:hypothetical protein
VKLLDAGIGSDSGASVGAATLDSRVEHIASARSAEQRCASDSRGFAIELLNKGMNMSDM